MGPKNGVVVASVVVGVVGSTLAVVPGSNESSVLSCLTDIELEIPVATPTILEVELAPFSVVVWEMGVTVAINKSSFVCE